MKLAWFLSALIIGSTAYAEAPDRGTVSIQSLEYRGTGCATNTATINISPDNQAFTIFFSNFMVDTSERQGRPVRKTCELNMSLAAPLGWSYTIVGVQVRGYASLETGVVGAQTLFAKIGSTTSQIAKLPLRGPYTDDFMNTAAIPLQNAQWSACDNNRQRPLHLRSALNIRPAGARFNDDQGDVDDPSLGTNLPSGLITIDSVDGELTQIYSISWKRCPGQRNPNLNGNWNRDGALTEVKGSGDTFTLVNRLGVVSRGEFVSPTEIVALDWANLHGQIQNNNNTIVWDNQGGIWNRGWTPLIVPKIDGAWNNAGVNQRIEQRNNDLIFINERGEGGKGRFISPTELVIIDWDHLRGTLVDNNKKIVWANGAQWLRGAAGPGGSTGNRP